MNLTKGLALAVLAVLVLALAAFADAPVANGVYNSQTAISVDSVHDGTWQEIDSAIVSKTDTCFTYYFVSGTITLQPGQKFYLAFRDSPDGARANTKTWSLPEGCDGPMTIAFGNMYIDSLISQTDASDSIFVDAACLGRGVTEDLTIDTWFYTGNVVDISR